MLRKGFCTAIILLALCLSSPAFAWDPSGHEQIADIAWTRLDARAKQEITLILIAGDPAFRPLNTSEAEVRRAFRRASTFPDDIKVHRDTAYESLIDTMNRKWQPQPDPNDREALYCKTWHYYDTPIRFQGPKPPVRPSNALVALDEARRQLDALERSANPDRRMQCWWLYWVEHLTGDLHQPLHCVSSYEFSPQGDQGGNAFKLGISAPDRPKQKVSLHFYWDAGIDHAVVADRAQGLSDQVEEVSRRWAVTPALQPSTSESRDLDVRAWIGAGAVLADRVVYHAIRPGDAPSDGYNRTMDDLCRRQTVLAGYRLAAILNATLGRPRL